MALRKTTLDIQAADGLQQKIALQRLPPGKSAKALNLVKNKQGRLEKRLGFAPLSGTDPFGSSFTYSTGLNLGTWNNNVFVVGRGNWSPIGANTTALSQWSDDLNGLMRRGPLPDVKVVTDTVLSNTPTFALSPSVVISGDFAVMVWIDCPSLSVGPEFGNVYWQAWETSTGDMVQPPSRLYTGKAGWLRLAVVPTSPSPTFVVCYNDGNNGGNIYCETNTLANIKSGVAWNNVGAIVTTATGFFTTQVPFDMRSATGDTTDFVLAYEIASVAEATPTAIRVDRRQAASPATLDAVFIVNPSPNSLGITSIAVRADVGVNNRCAVAYYQPTSSAYPAGAAPTIHAAACVYPSMAFENGSSSNDALLYTAPNVHENPAAFMDIIYCGNSGQLGGHNTWAVVHTPFGAVWNGVSETNGVTQGNTDRHVSAAPIASRCAKIITNSFQDGTSAIVPWSNMSGSNAGITPGVTLASRGCEANGIAYFLGWVPSLTQGSFIALAFDNMADPTVTALGNPMRPVANLQVRTAIADPGAGEMAGQFTVANACTGPNGWSGGSEWQFKGDIYKTSYVGYVSATIGERMQPAYGAIQLTPLVGYHSNQWGSLTGIAAGVPCVYDGQNVFEQGFLYSPESLLVVVGSTVGSGKGPKYTATTMDAYSWIFTWEQFDAQGNYHISARSTPLTLTQTQAGGAGQYNPTFYVPTLGPTMRQVSPRVNSFMGAIAIPTGNVTLGAYRTVLNGSVYFRITDRFYNGADPVMQAGSLPNLTFNKIDNSCFVTFQDTVSDSIGTGTAPLLDDGTHPLLYGDGTTGAPGSLDNFCPPSSAIMVRHKERFFVARGNQVLFTKQRGENAGPGYNEQVNAFFVGDDTPIIGMESLDDRLIIFKPNQLFYVTGDGPQDDGSGTSFSNPQPIPTDAGCSDPESIRATPEGLYFMSTAGLRMLSRSMAVEYVGGPVEDELAKFADVRSVVLYPSQNRVVFAATQADNSIDGVHPLGELVIRDYVLDAWTTAQIQDGVTFRTPAALAVGNAPSIQFAPNLQPSLYMLTTAGALWRERDPLSLTPYFDNGTYVSSVWQSPLIKQQDGGRFRLWDIVTFGQSQDPHGLLIQVAIDDGAIGFGNLYTWVWNGTGTNNIAPGGVAPPLTLTRLRSYDGRFGADFQVQVTDVSDAASSTGQGFQLLGLSLSLGVAPGPYKLPPGSTQ